MTMPDPDPSTTPALDQGGAQQPGDTPPAEASTTAGLSHREPALPTHGTNWFVYLLVLLVVGLACLYFVGAAVGVLD